VAGNASSASLKPGGAATESNRTCHPAFELEDRKGHRRQGAGLGVRVGVALGVGDGVALGVADGVGVGTGVGVGVALGFGVAVGVGVELAPPLEPHPEL